MKIQRIKIANYKGFSDSGWICLDPKWNVIVGQNNSGKTAFIDCLRVREFKNHPHKSSAFPRGFAYPERSEVYFEIETSGPELNILALERGNAFSIPYSHELYGACDVEIYFQKFFAEPNLTIPINFLGENTGASCPRYPSHGLFSVDNAATSVLAHIDHRKKIFRFDGPVGNKTDNIPDVVIGSLPSNIFVFSAERFSLGTCSASESPLLDRNARNLASVLAHMSGNPALYAEFNANINAIFPNVHWVSSVPIKNNQFEARIWTSPTEKGRDDLAIPLDECGTGIGQVLAILYVAMTHLGGVIAIDEPNSFLHPGAAKKLIQILKRYDSHQIIISTHSSEVISASQPAALHMVRVLHGESQMRSFDGGTIDATRMMLEEIGTSLSDVFGFDRIVWVEGPTEKECFDLLAKKFFPEKLIGLSFVALRNTGDFEAKNASSKSVLDIYDALSRGGAILPVSVAFSFDREGKTSDQVDDLKRRCSGRAKVLPRRMTENYLLDARSISMTLTDLGEVGIRSEEVEGLLFKFSVDRMPREAIKSFNDPNYYTLVDGAKLLSDVFHAATDGRQSYRKVRDGVSILKNILKVNPDGVSELVDFVDDLMESTLQ